MPTAYRFDADRSWVGLMVDRSNYAPSKYVRRAARCALAHGVALELGRDGSIKILGRLNAMSSDKKEETTPERSGHEEVETQAVLVEATSQPIPAASKVLPPLRRKRLAEDYLSLQRVAYELAVSRWTLWRASRSDIEGFPAPYIVGRRTYWKKADLPALDLAMDFFQGRPVFDRKRKEARQSRE